MYERGAADPNVDTVRYGFLNNIAVVGNELVFRFNEEGTFTRAITEELADRLGLKHLEQGRAHWALKDGGIPNAMLAKLRYSYDVVFSFAGEDRPYVEQVAAIMRERGVKVFYENMNRFRFGKESRRTSGPDLSVQCPILRPIHLRALRPKELDNSREALRGRSRHGRTNRIHSPCQIRCYGGAGTTADRGVHLPFEQNTC
jgi:hypothetical protein